MIGRCLCGVKNLPDFFAGILFISVITSFVIAVTQSDVSPLFPAISDTATKSPESNIFSQLVNISTFIGLILMYIRYLQVNRDIERFEGAGVTRYLNRYILPIGLIAILGCSIVANFPETQVSIVHFIGALMLFVFGNTYVCTQVVISFKMKRMGVISSRLCITRLILAILSAVSYVLTFAMLRSAYKKRSGINLKWNSDDPGYKEHVVGNVFEWVMVFSFLLVFLTFRRELKNNKLRFRLVQINNGYEPTPVQSDNMGE